MISCRSQVTQMIVSAKVSKKLSWGDIAGSIGM